MICKILGFHGGDYEECCLLGYENPVRTSQETHYVSVTETSQLMPCKIEVFTAVTMKNAIYLPDSCHHYNGGAEVLRIVGCYKSHTA
jgi:hypothetical protein